MADTEWYRKTTWTEEDQSHFFQKLKRARQWSRSQYLRIQAYYLQKAEIFLPAIELLEQFVADYPDDAHLAVTWEQMAECKRAVGDVDGAVEAYRRSVAQMRVRTNVMTSAAQDFPLMVAELGLTELFDEAKGLLGADAADNALFAVGGFKLHAARALILASEGYHDGAHSEAVKALDLAGIRKSGIPHHQNIGLVGKSQADIIRRLLDIVGLH